MSNKFPAMLAHKFDAKRIKTWPVAVEPKLDGVRCLLVVDGDGCKAFSRAGKPFTSLAAIQFEAARMYRRSGLNARIVLDGTVSQVRAKGVQAQDAVFTAFDIIPASVYFGDRPPAETWNERREVLEDFLDSVDVPACIRLSDVQWAESANEIMELYAEHRDEGHEGSVVKLMSSPWSPRRSYAYMKLKANETEDLPVAGRE